MYFSQAEARAEFAEKTVKKLQKEVDRLEGLIFYAILFYVDNNLLIISMLKCLVQCIWAIKLNLGGIYNIFDVS